MIQYGDVSIKSHIVHALQPSHIMRLYYATPVGVKHVITIPLVSVRLPQEHHCDSAVANATVLVSLNSTSFAKGLHELYPGGNLLE